MNNRKGVYKADENLWLPTDSIWLSGIAAKLALYYPYDAAQTTAGKLNLTSAVRTDDTKDLWSTRFEADSHTKDISLTLTQLYSRLSITFVKLTDAEYTGTSALTGLKLAGAGIYSAATYTWPTASTPTAQPDTRQPLPE
ncbi:fimbrillin family protein [Bacteroides sp. CR5/BHMF/2]|nr:fimbrillin family protein [Bacteroides sp. CR5/BHMF/2]